MAPLMELLDSEDKMCRLKGLFAISCMIRGCSQAHAWFTERNGVTKMIELMGSSEGHARIVRKCHETYPPYLFKRYFVLFF